MLGKRRNNKEIRVALLTGGWDPHYAIGLASSLASQDVYVEFIGNDEMEGAAKLKHDNIVYFNLRKEEIVLAFRDNLASRI